MLIIAIVDMAHELNLLVHIDGVRVANAVAFLDMGLKEMVVDTGVDIVSFGGTKNGMMCGEALLYQSN